MPRKADIYWHGKNKAWVSAIGEVGANGRRRPVYFRDIPYGPDGGANHRKAKAALAAFLAARDARRKEAEDLTFGELARLYLRWLGDRVERGKAKANTRRSHAQALTKFLATPGAGGVLLDRRPAHELTGTEVGTVLERWATADDLGPNYLGRILSSVQAVLNWAADPLPGRQPEKLLAANPIAKLSHEATKAPQSPDRYAAEAEVRAFLAWGYARAENYSRSQSYKKSGRTVIKSGPLERRFERLTIDLIRVAYLTGTRPGELRIAEWGDYKPQAVQVAGAWWGLIKLDPKRWKSGGKTGKARVVFLPPEAVEVIEAIQALEGRHPRFIWTHKRGPVPRTREASLDSPADAPASHGVPWSESALPNKVCALRKEAIAAGVPLLDEGPDRFVMYRLRHTRAAELLMAGVDVGTVAKLLGTSVEMIEKTYGSYTSSHLAEAAARGIAAPPPPSPGAG